MWNVRRWWPKAIAILICSTTAGAMWRARGLEDARAVYLALAEQRYAYEGARSMAADALHVAAAGQHVAAARSYAALGMLQLVERNLLAVAGTSDTRLVLLAPVLRSLRQERLTLEVALQAVDQGVTVQFGIAKPLDVWQMSMHHLRQTWGLRQKQWRGRPLTA